jgi:hypothetical protein
MDAAFRILDLTFREKKEATFGDLGTWSMTEGPKRKVLDRLHLMCLKCGSRWDATESLDERRK